MKSNLRFYAILSCGMLGLSACQEETLVQNVEKKQCDYYWSLEE